MCWEGTVHMHSGAKWDNYSLVNHNFFDMSFTHQSLKRIVHPGTVFPVWVRYKMAEHRTGENCHPMQV